MNPDIFSPDAFPKLKSCAKYIVDNISELSTTSAKSNNFVTVNNTGTFLSSNQNTFPYNSNLLNFFKNISEGKSVEEVKKNLELLLAIEENNSSPTFPFKARLKISEIKHGIHNYISLFTQDVNMALSILKELDLFFLQIEKYFITEHSEDIYNAEITRSELNYDNLYQQDTFYSSTINEPVNYLIPFEEAKKDVEAKALRNRLLIENSSDLISTHNKEGVFLSASPSSKYLLGYTPEELVGKSIFCFLHEEDAQKIKSALSKIWEKENVPQTCFRFKSKNGEFTWFESTGRAIKNPKTNDVLELQVSSRDITGRKQTELELAKERQYLMAVLENVNDAIVACDENGIISFFNKAARNLHGLPEKPLSPEEWASYYDLYCADCVTLMKTEDIPLFRAFRGEHIENVEIVVAPKNEKKRVLLATAKQINTRENKVWGAVVAMHDITEKKEWENKILKKEALLSESQSMAHLGSWEWNTETGELTWSEELKNIFQFDPDLCKDSLSGQPYLDFVHPDHFDEVKGCFEKIILNEESFKIEHKVALKNGTVKWVLSKAKVLETDNKNCLSGILLDLTELKKVEQKVKEEKRLLQKIALASPDIIFVQDLSSNKVIYMNRDFGKVLGYDHKDLNIWKNRNLDNLVHPDDKEVVEAFNKKLSVINDQEILEAKYRIKDINNRYYWFLFRCTLFARDEKEKPKQVIGLIQDITEKIKAENALKHREAQLLAAQKLAKAGSFVYDIKRDLLSWSPEMYRIFGHQPNLIPISLKAFEHSVHPDDLEQVKKNLKESLEKGKFLDLEHRIILPDHSIRYISTRGRILFNKKGEAAKLLGSTMDVTDRKGVEEELQKKNKSILNAYQKLEEAQKDLNRVNNRLEDMVKERTKQLLNINKELKEKNKELLVINSDLDNFIYTASHDLKSPISNLEGLVNLLTSQMAEKAGSTEADIVKMIGTSVKKFKQTIQDLTEITKVQKEENEKSEIVSFSKILEEVKSDMNPMILESEAKIISDFKIKELPYAVKNLRSIIYNLLSNAIKYRSRERPLLIELNTDRDEHFVIFTVKDNGLGLQAEHKAKLFKMFKRFHTHVEGTGIGLYIVKRIIENNGGKIEVESELGKGSTFKVFFNVKELIIYEKI